MLLIAIPFDLVVDEGAEEADLISGEDDDGAGLRGHEPIGVGDFERGNIRSGGGVHTRVDLARAKWRAVAEVPPVAGDGVLRMRAERGVEGERLAHEADDVRRRESRGWTFVERKHVNADCLVRRFGALAVRDERGDHERSRTGIACDVETASPLEVAPSPKFHEQVVGSLSASLPSAVKPIAWPTNTLKGDAEMLISGAALGTRKVNESVQQMYCWTYTTYSAAFL